MAPIDPAVRVDHVTKTFGTGRGRVTALDDVSLQVDEGEFVVLLGPSGCGKTTMLRSVAGLERPDRGEIAIGDRTAFAHERRIDLPPERRQLAMVFQSYALWPHLSVESNVTFPLVRQGVGRAEARRRAGDILDLVGCGHLGARIPTQLSGGQQQRVALARAIVAGQRLILFDEPLSNVDAKIREQLRSDIARMQHELRFAALYVTHDQAEALMLADRVAVMSAGSVVQQGTPREIYERPSSRYVAEFVGSANLVPGTVTGHGAEVTIKTAVGDIVCAGDPAGSDPVYAFFRPESCDLSTDPTPNRPNQFEVEVRQVSYQGPMVEYAVACGNQELRVLVPARSRASRFAAGDRAHLGIDPHDIQLLAAGPAEPEVSEVDGWGGADDGGVAAEATLATTPWLRS